MYLITNLKTYMVGYLRKQLRFDNETWPIHGILHKNLFLEN